VWISKKINAPRPISTNKLISSCVSIGEPTHAMKTRAAVLRFPSSRPDREVAVEGKSAPRLGLCLSSGGARGLAHVGVIQVLEEAGVPISAIAGTSMGAYVGSLYAAGLHYPDLYKLAAEIPDRRTLLRLLDPVIPPTAGLIKGEKMRHHLERTLGHLTFSELPIPLYIAATNLDTLSPTVFDSGPVAEAVHASAAIPGVFAPVTIAGQRYTDGGAAAPLPVTLLRERSNVDYIIAVNVVPHHSPPPPVKSRWNPCRWLNLLAAGNVLDTFNRALMSAQRQLVAKESACADVVIRPEVAGSKWYDYEHFEHYIRAGREAARAALPQILALLHPEPPHCHEPPPRHTIMGNCAA
jgi:NTE family protein